MVAFRKRIHFRTGESERCVAFQLFLHVLIRVIDDLLQADDVGFLGQYDVPADLTSFFPGAARLLGVFRQSGYADVACHYPVRAFFLRVTAETFPGGHCRSDAHGSEKRNQDYGLVFQYIHKRTNVG